MCKIRVVLNDEIAFMMKTARSKITNYSDNCQIIVFEGREIEGVMIIMIKVNL